MLPNLGACVTLWGTSGGTLCHLPPSPLPPPPPPLAPLLPESVWLVRASLRMALTWCFSSSSSSPQCRRFGRVHGMSGVSARDGGRSAPMEVIFR
jgi:hypothetical protein